MPDVTQKQLKRSIAVIIILLVFLVVTTFALVYTTVSVENNLFRTGRVKINLNNGEPVVREDEFLFEPGATIQKEFFIENLSTWDVYYKIYFGNVSGSLADYVNIRILDGADVLFSGRISDLNKDNVIAADDPLTVGEKKYLTAEFTFDREAGNIVQGQRLGFDMNAVAVQTKNNPDRAFE